MQGKITGPHYPIVLLLVITMAAAFLPLVGFIAYGIEVREDEALRREKLRMTEHAETLAQSVDRELRSQLELAEALTTNAALHSGDLEAFWRTARAVGDVVGGNFVLIDQNMQQVVNTRVPFGSPLPPTNDVETTRRVFESAKPLIGDLQAGAMFKEQLFTIRVPVRVNGNVLYSLSYAARAGSILRVVEQSFRPDGWVASVVDGNGLFLARSRRHEALYGTPVQPAFHQKTASYGLALENDMEGRKAYVTYHRLPNTGWTILIWAPREVLEAPSAAAWRNLYLSVVLAGILVLVAAAIANALIRRPTLRLLKAAHQLGNGQPVTFKSTLMAEANVVGSALGEASLEIDKREHALREREHQLTVLLRELSHRTKNLLAVIQAMASQSMKQSKDVKAWERAFRHRLGGLSRSHDLLVGTDWAEVDLLDLVNKQLEPFIEGHEDRVRVSGPSIRLKPEAAQALGMALHELGANAVLHGAFSSTQKRVDVTWSIDSVEQDAKWTLSWRESGGSPCASPDRWGFGLTVLKKLTPASVFGDADFHWRDDGCEWLLTAPISGISPGAFMGTVERDQIKNPTAAPL